jgi:hypothetical protein
MGYFFIGKSWVLFLYEKLDWATFWAIFTLTHLVTLILTQFRVDNQATKQKTGVGMYVTEDQIFRTTRPDSKWDWLW